MLSSYFFSLKSFIWLNINFFFFLLITPPPIPQISQKKKKLEASCRYCLLHYPWIFIIWFYGTLFDESSDEISTGAFNFYWGKWSWYNSLTVYGFSILVLFSQNYCCLVEYMFQFLVGQLFSIPQHFKYFFDYYVITQSHFSKRSLFFISLLYDNLFLKNYFKGVLER